MNECDYLLLHISGAWGASLAYGSVWFEYKNRRWFRGRSTRREWWTELFYLFLVSAIASALGPVAGTIIGTWRLVLFWAVTARRLHDLNQSAWLQVGVIACFIGASLGVLALDDGTGWFANVVTLDSTLRTNIIPVISSLSVFINLAFYGWLGFFKGTEGPNAWGEDAPAQW